MTSVFFGSIVLAGTSNGQSLESLRPGFEFIQQGKTDAAVEYFSRQAPPGSVGEFAAALTLYHNNNTEQAIIGCRRILQKHPGAPNVIDLLCSAESIKYDQHQNNFNDVMEAMSRSLEVVRDRDDGVTAPRLMTKGGQTDSTAKRVKEFLQDRPDFDPEGQTGAFIREWLTRVCSGAHGGPRLELIVDPPGEVKLACHGYPNQWNTAEILIPRPKATAFQESQLAALCFEVFNAQSNQEFRAVSEDAVNGDLCREQFVARCTRLEFDAVHQLRYFYVKEVVPRFKNDDVSTNPNHWFSSVPTSFAMYMSRFEQTAEYPWKFYGQGFDALHATGYYLKGLRDIDANRIRFGAAIQQAGE